MKTQISRHSHRPDKRYDGVFQQQGRMLTDADWNELVHILNDRLDRALGDVIGSGVPEGEGALSIDGQDVESLRLRAGRIYVDGVPARLMSGDDEFIPIDRQPDLPPGLPAIPPKASGWIYADVWTRTITALEDAELADPALHGADTCTRTRTMVQIKWYGGARPPHEALPRRGAARLTVKTSGPSPEARGECGGVIDVDAPTGNALLRVEVHAVEGDPARPTGVTLKWSLENGAEVYDLAAGERPPARFWRGEPTCYEVFELDDELQMGMPASPGRRRGARPRLLSVADAKTVVDQRGGRFIRRWDGFSAWSLGGPAEPLEFAVGPVACRVDAAVARRAVPFMVGDHWLVAIREGADTAEGYYARTLPPAGIEHRYLTLARLDEGKVIRETPVVAPAFPSLTRLKAEHIAFESSGCEGGLYDGWEGKDDWSEAKTVSDALHRICELEARHVRTDVVESEAHVQGALQHLLGEIAGLHAQLADMRSRDDCGARLALFGRGVLEGLIPTVELRVGKGLTPELLLRTSAGRIIDSQGCVRDVPECLETFRPRAGNKEPGRTTPAVPTIVDRSTPDKPKPLRIQPPRAKPTGAGTGDAAKAQPRPPSANVPEGAPGGAPIMARPVTGEGKRDAAPQGVAEHGQAPAAPSKPMSAEGKAGVAVPVPSNAGAGLPGPAMKRAGSTRIESVDAQVSPSDKTGGITGAGRTPLAVEGARRIGEHLSGSEPSATSSLTAAGLDIHGSAVEIAKAIESAMKGKGVETMGLYLHRDKGAFGLAVKSDKRSGDAADARGWTFGELEAVLDDPQTAGAGEADMDGIDGTRKQVRTQIASRYRKALASAAKDTPQFAVPASKALPNSAALHERQWSTYAALTTMRPEPIAQMWLRLGTVLMTAERAWVIPDGREAIITTPARVGEANQLKRATYLDGMRRLIQQK